MSEPSIDLRSEEASPWRTPGVGARALLGMLMLCLWLVGRYRRDADTAD